MYFAGDPAYPWHHRLLLLRVEGSRWIVATPTLDLEVTDLQEAEDLVTLQRDGEFPAACVPRCSFNAIGDGNSPSFGLGLVSWPMCWAWLLLPQRETKLPGTSPIPRTRILAKLSGQSYFWGAEPSCEEVGH